MYMEELLLIEFLRDLLLVSRCLMYIYFYIPEITYFLVNWNCRWKEAKFYSDPTYTLRPNSTIGQRLLNRVV